jgi:hypothetical protein
MDSFPRSGRGLIPEINRTPRARLNSGKTPLKLDLSNLNRFLMQSVDQASQSREATHARQLFRKALLPKKNRGRTEKGLAKRGSRKKITKETHAVRGQKTRREIPIILEIWSQYAHLSDTQKPADC